MDDKEFDNYIKEKLQQGKGDSQADWDLMHRMLVDEDIISDASDSGFDQTVKEQVDSARAPYNEGHWAILHEKLLTERYLKKRIAVVKGIELLMLFLLCFTVISLVPFKSELYAVHKYRPSIEKLQNLVKKSYVQLFSHLNEETISAGHIETVVPIESDGVSNFKSSFVHDNTIEQVERLSGDTKSLPETPMLHKSLLPLWHLPRELHAQEAKPPVITTSSNRQIITASIGFSADLIETPFDNTIGIESLKYTDLSKHISVTYGIESGRYEAFTGLGFYSTDYSPSISTGVFDSFRGDPIPLSEIQEIRYSFINLPLGLRYFLRKGDRWSIYAVASANINALATADYQLEELSELDKKLAKLSPKTINQSNLRAGIDSDVSVGLLQGGSLLDNLYTSANIGFGVNASLDNRLSLFVQPSYTRSFSLTGVGAQQENIDNVRLDLGLRLAI